jgi:plasmid maintenance system killer protein
MNQEKEQGFPNYRVSICSLTKVAPSVSFTPHEEKDDYLVAATDKYDICCNEASRYLKISKKGSTLAKHEIDRDVYYSLLINQQRELLFNTWYTLYLQDLNNINNAPKQLFKSTNGRLENIVQTSDATHSILCNNNQVIVVENASSKHSVTRIK